MLLYVPEFQFNLISIQKVRQDLSCTITFTTDQCFLQFLHENKKAIHVDNIQVGLYSMNFQNLKLVQIQNHFCNTTCLSDAEDAKL